MLTRKIIRPDLIQSLRCYSCDVELTDFEITSYDVFDGMCEECYSQAMEAAFDDEFVYREGVDYDE